jgi:hypothetical protein
VLALVLGLFAFLVPVQEADATTLMYTSTLTGCGGPCPSAPTGTTWCKQWYAANLLTGTLTCTGVCGPPLLGTDSAHCTNGTGNGGTGGTTASTFPVCSSTSGNLDLLSTLGGATGYTSTGGFCSNGCEYVNGNSTLQVGTATNRLAGAAVPTGVSCDASGAAAGGDALTQNSSCVKGGSGGQTTCADGTDNVAMVSSQTSGTFNVIPANTPSAVGTCVGYADGSAACNAGPTGTMQTPPGPSTSTNVTVPATPTATVQEGTGGNVINYYNSTTVAASKGTVGTAGSTVANPNQGQSASGSGTGTGTSGSGPGDCMLQPGEAGADDPAGCNGTTPSLTRSDTVQSNIQALYSGIAASPIMSSLTSIGSGFPSAGSCPTASFTIWGTHTFDLLTGPCSIFASNLSTLQTIFDLIWCLIGIVIVMTA